VASERAAALARRHAASLGVLLVWAGAAGLFARWTSRVDGWGVMTDELLYAKLAAAAGTTLSPLPTLDGERIGLVNQLYPLVLAPFYGTLDVPAAFAAAHALNAALMGSAAVPAFLLARRLVPPAWALAVAVLAVLLPWAALSAFLLSEVVGYPAFLWVVLAFQRCLVSPSLRNDVLALAACAVAVLARTQFALLAAALPVAVVAHEVGRRRSLREGLREAVRGHRTLVAACAALAFAAAAAAAAGSLGRAFGSYAVTVEGNPLPAGVWEAAAVHLDVLAVAIGVVPLLLGGAWALASVVRPAGREAHALAVLSVLLVSGLALETASYDLRFGLGDPVRDRYLFYVVPLLLVAAAAALRERRPLTVPLAALTVLFAVTVRAHDFDAAAFSVDSPAAVLNEAIRDAAGALSPETFVALAGLLLGGSLALATRLVPGRALAASLGAAVLALTAVETRTAFAQALDAAHAAPARDWVDAAVPDGARAAALPFPLSADWGATATRWWDVEFWNRSVRRTLVAAGGEFSYTPFAAARLQLDVATGRLETADQPAYVVVAPGDRRFRLAGRVVAEREGLELVAAERPYRADWATRGLEPDGWTRPGRQAALRVYAVPGDGDRRVDVALGLVPPPGAAGRYRVEAGSARRARTLAAPAGRRELLSVCVPAGGFADVTISAGALGEVPGIPRSQFGAFERRVGVGLAGIDVVRRGRCG
jgi:hypothetical protein